MEKKETTKNI